MSIENGQVNYNASEVTNGDSEYYYVDTMASFSCNFGFSLSGSNSSICQISAGGTWNPHIPICIQGDEIIQYFACWGLIGIILMVVFGFLPQIFGQ